MFKKIGKALKNFCKKNRIYLITIVVSIGCILPYLLAKENIDNTCLIVLSGIGCSGIAAALMAIFLDIKIDNDRKNKINNAKATYFKSLYNELSTILQRILWFENRLEEDDFDWTFPAETYSTLSYMVSVSNYPTESITFEDMTKRLEECSQKYGFEKIKTFSPEKQVKIQKMFSIIATSSYYLQLYLKDIKQNKIMLSVEDYLSLDVINDLDREINMALTIMGKPNKNYGLSITFLKNSLETIRKECGYTNDFSISIFGSVPMSEF